MAERQGLFAAFGRSPLKGAARRQCRLRVLFGALRLRVEPEGSHQACRTTKIKKAP